MIPSLFLHNYLIFKFEKSDWDRYDFPSNLTFDDGHARPAEDPLITMPRQSQHQIPRTLRRLLMATIGALMGTGCMAVGPDYIRPDSQFPDQWHTGLTNGLASTTSDPQTLAYWWRILDDPVLSGFMARAVNGNLTLQEAMARIHEARARRSGSRSALFPAVDGSAAAAAGDRRSSEGPSNQSELYSAGFDAGWELDLFGGVRRSVEAADADLAASHEFLRDILVSLLAEVAVAYVDARTFQTRLDVAQANLQTQEETYLIVRARFESGLSSELPAQQALYNLSGTRAGIPDLESGLEQAKNRLAVLLGLTPGQVHTELAPHRPIPVTPATVAVGIPADVVRQRPDVRRAERLLAGQTARIGVAAAQLYPSIRLSGSIGLEALSVGDLVHAPTRIWKIGPAISWPVFDAGAIRANIAVQTAAQEQALLQYEQVVLSALEEVENSLTTYANEIFRQQFLTTALQAAQQAAMLARDQYKAGVVSFSEVLEAQRATLSFQDQLAQSDGSVTTNLIRLYKSLGGGWAALAEYTPIHSE
jgi:NodT family efflux transporter outer membrane factor (OMF) lipoprotein